MRCQYVQDGRSRTPSMGGPPCPCMGLSHASSAAQPSQRGSRHAGCMLCRRQAVASCAVARPRRHPVVVAVEAQQVLVVLLLRAAGFGQAVVPGLAALDAVLRHPAARGVAASGRHDKPRCSMHS